MTWEVVYSNDSCNCDDISCDLSSNCTLIVKCQSRNTRQVEVVPYHLFSDISDELEVFNFLQLVIINIILSNTIEIYKQRC